MNQSAASKYQYIASEYQYIVSKYQYIAFKNQYIALKYQYIALKYQYIAFKNPSVTVKSAIEKYDKVEMGSGSKFQLINQNTCTVKHLNTFLLMEYSLGKVFSTCVFDDLCCALLYANMILLWKVISPGIRPHRNVVGTI